VGVLLDYALHHSLNAIPPSPPNISPLTARAFVYQPTFLRFSEIHSFYYTKLYAMANPFCPLINASAAPAAAPKRKRDTTMSSEPVPSSLDVSGRTMKRTRARPNEEQVQQYTLEKLFSAAKISTPAPTKSKMSSFMSLFKRSAPVEMQITKATRCEDCDRSMEFHGEREEEELHCISCKRTVCDMGCSSSNGMGRVCLECARHR
jgi:hypothetical protein